MGSKKIRLFINDKSINQFWILNTATTCFSGSSPRNRRRSLPGQQPNTEVHLDITPEAFPASQLEVEGNAVVIEKVLTSVNTDKDYLNKFKFKPEQSRLNQDNEAIMLNQPNVTQPVVTQPVLTTPILNQPILTQPIMNQLAITQNLSQDNSQMLLDTSSTLPSPLSILSGRLNYSSPNMAVTGHSTGSPASYWTRRPNHVFHPWPHPTNTATMVRVPVLPRRQASARSPSLLPSISPRWHTLSTISAGGFRLTGWMPLRLLSTPGLTGLVLWAPTRSLLGTVMVLWPAALLHLWPTLFGRSKEVIRPLCVLLLTRANKSRFLGAMNHLHPDRCHHGYLKVVTNLD